MRATAPDDVVEALFDSIMAPDLDVFRASTGFVVVERKIAERKLDENAQKKSLN